MSGPIEARSAHPDESAAIGRRPSALLGGVCLFLGAGFALLSFWIPSLPPFGHPDRLPESRAAYWIALAALAALSMVLARGGARRRIWKLGVGVWCAAALSLALEFTLGAVGLQPARAPIELGDGSSDAFVDREVFVADPWLRWRFRPHARHLGITINSHGYNDSEWLAEKPPGVRRVICLGDSCTAQARVPYSKLLHDRLTAFPPSADTWEAFNMAVHGYSSAQGAVLFERDARALAPDFVTLYYGWNDHWLARGATDRERLAAEQAPAARLRNTLGRRRFPTLLARLLASEPPAAERTPDAHDRLRVPPDEYRRNLTRLVESIRASGAVPILITAPRAATLAEDLVPRGFARSIDEALALHDQYVAITREVATATGADLIDLAAILSGPEASALFSRDGIHFVDAGRAAIADAIFDALSELAD